MAEETERDEEMREEPENEVENDTENETGNDEREEETVNEIRDEVYVNDDVIEMLRLLEKRITILDEKVDNMISMYVDSGAIVQETVDDVSEQERDNYEEDFINIDDLDLAL